MATHADIAHRVAARFLRADEQIAPPAQQQQALPKSGPGKMIIQKAIDELLSAVDAGDDAAYDSAIDKLVKAKGNRSPSPV